MKNKERGFVLMELAIMIAIIGIIISIFIPIISNRNSPYHPQIKTVGDYSTVCIGGVLYLNQGWNPTPVFKPNSQVQTCP